MSTIIRNKMWTHGTDFICCSGGRDIVTMQDLFFQYHPNNYLTQALLCIKFSKESARILYQAIKEGRFFLFTSKLNSDLMICVFFISFQSQKSTLQACGYLKLAFDKFHLKRNILKKNLYQKLSPDSRLLSGKIEIRSASRLNTKNFIKNQIFKS